MNKENMMQKEEQLVDLPIAAGTSNAPPAILESANNYKNPYLQLA